MAYTLQLYKELLTAGSNIDIPYNLFMPSVLKDFAALAKAHGGMLTIYDAENLAPSTLKELANIGQRSVRFVFQK